MLKIRCDYCGNFISDTDENCPHCGAPNAHLQRSAAGVPKTIAELRAFAAAHDLPMAQMRFFLGEDCREPRAFGIYQDEEGLFVVYKNKASGERAVRYRGRDEAYAVNELWQKMRTEVQQRKSGRTGTRSSAPQRKMPGKWYQNPLLIFAAAFLAFALIGGLADRNTPDQGYYSYDGGHYYYDSDDWYLYDAGTDDWYETDVDSDLHTNYGDYYEGSGYSSGADYEDFQDSDAYADSDTEDSSWDSDWDDDDWDWDSGDSWDSSDTDWDSDW